jgi:hypothetical protein
METTTTRISDLPENITMSGGGGGGEMSTQYAPINIHPNPYGNSTQNPPFMPNPQQASSGPKNNFSYNGGSAAAIPPQVPGPQSQYLSEEQQMYIKQMQNQRLPSRDIPRDQTIYTQDDEIKPNYIPKPIMVNDYVREQQQTTENNMREYEEKKRRENRLDAIITEFQTPVFVALLFFIFQMPIINTMIFKKFSFLSLYNDDGNFNLNGLILKSALFGSMFYGIMKGTFIISEL